VIVTPTVEVLKTAVTLLAGAGLLLRSLQALGNVSSGFDMKNVLTLRITGSWAEADMDKRARRTLDFLETIPGVERAATVFSLPGVPTQYPTELTLVEGREVPWSLLVKDMPKEKHRDLDFIVDEHEWDANCDENFKDNHYLEPVPVADTRKEGYVDRWIVYGKVDGEQLFTAKELTVDPGVK